MSATPPTKDFDAVCDLFTSYARTVANWQLRYYGAAYSTRLKAAIADMKFAIAEAEKHPEIGVPAAHPSDGGVAGEPVAIEKIVREYFDSALRWEPVFEDGRGSNDLKIWETSDLLCKRFMRAIKQYIALPPVPGNEGREAIIEECAKVAEAQIAAFLSPQYAAIQPLGSICERFACEEVAKAIRGLSHSRSEG